MSCFTKKKTCKWTGKHINYDKIYKYIDNDPVNTEWIMCNKLYNATDDIIYKRSYSAYCKDCSKTFIAYEYKIVISS